MIAMKRSCLDRDEIELVLCGQLSEGDFESAISHLDDCDQCRSVAESVQKEGQWLVDCLDGETTDPFQVETACQVALWQVMETPSFSGLADSAGDSLPQEMLGPYRLIRPLGSGGMAAVYLAEHVRLRRKCAIKILPRDRVDQPGWLDRFDREMTTVAALEHPHVVRATDAGHQDGWHYLVMEHLDGLDVGRIAAAMGQLDVADACEIVRQAALGLAHVHASGLVHRDVKPSNLMLTRDGNIKLLDLGLVLSGDDPLSVDDRLTTVGHLMGTMPYMAPEQLIDSREVDARADIYAAGATLYRLIAGKPPHHGRGGLAKQVMAITNQDAPRVDTVRDDLDPDLVALVTDMTSRDPERRPQTAEEVAERLGQFSSHGQLKRCLRQAMRRPAARSRSISTFNASALPPAEVPARVSWRWRIATGTMFVLLLLTGFLVKIATDRGELVIDSERDGVILSIRKGDRLVEQLELKVGPDNRVTLHKGTYQIGIDGGGDEFALSNNVVTIGRGSEETIDLKPKSAMRLYQGKNLDQWMTLLQSEEDPNTLGQIMGAVEVLTRETDKRSDAAQATLHTARIWGGFSSSSPEPGPSGMVSDSPSQHYMHHLNKVFPRYGDDGLEAIDIELDQGNTRSRQAAIWNLSSLVNTDAPMPPRIIEHLEKAVQAIREDDSSQAGDYSNKMAMRIAVQLLVRQDRDIAGHPLLEDYVRTSVANAVGQWRKNPQGVSGIAAFGGNSYPWVLEENILVAAVELEEAGQLEIDWEWLAAVLLNNGYRRVSDGTDGVFDAVAANAPDTLIDAISSALEKMTAATPMVNTFGHDATGSAFWHGNAWSDTFRLGTRNSIWPRALAYYADDAVEPESKKAIPRSRRRSRGVESMLPMNAVRNASPSLDRLQKLRTLMIEHGADPNHKEQPCQFIDAAIEKLKQANED